MMRSVDAVVQRGKRRAQLCVDGRRLLHEAATDTLKLAQLCHHLHRVDVRQRGARSRGEFVTDVLACNLKSFSNHVDANRAW